MMWPLALLLAGAPPDFKRDVVPIFEEYCLGCHASGMRMGSFECDTYRGRHARRDARGGCGAGQRRREPLVSDATR